MSQLPKGVTSDEMPVPRETPDPLHPGRLWLLAGCNLLLAAALEILFTVAQVHSDSLARAFGRSDGIYIQIAAAIFLLHALLAAIVPAVLAEGHRGLRSALIAGHIVIAWVIQTGGYSALFRFEAEMLAELASVNLLSTLGIVAGLWGGLALLATLWGWTLTRRPDVAQRPTFSVRGMLIAAAAAAFLFASPRLVAPIVTSVVRSIHANWMEDRRWVGTSSSIESEMNGMSLLVVPLVIGFLLAITLASAMWIGHSRWG